MGLTTSCPICRKPTASDADADFPFCSERCRMTDLGNWATGRYVISEPALDETAPEPTHRDDSER